MVWLWLIPYLIIGLFVTRRVRRWILQGASDIEPVTIWLLIHAMWPAILFVFLVFYLMQNGLPVLDRTVRRIYGG